MRCSARRSRAAATICMARVIFSMFLTLEMRSLTSRWVAMALPERSASARGLPLLGVALGVVVPGVVLVVLVALAGGLAAFVVVSVAGVLALGDPIGVALLHRMALLVEVVAEVVGELAHALLHRLDGAVVPVALRDLAQHV